MCPIQLEKIKTNDRLIFVLKFIQNNIAVQFQTGVTNLFNLRSDPDETRNIVNNRPDIVQKLLRLLHDSLVMVNKKNLEDATSFVAPALVIKNAAD
ncbi:MAG: hypothetical protein Fur0020_02100 [Thermodesulfovibrionia bacterium]